MTRLVTQFQRPCQARNQRVIQRVSQFRHRRVRQLVAQRQCQIRNQQVIR